MRVKSEQLAWFVIAAALIASPAGAAVSYRVTDLGAGSATSLNDVGQVLGFTASARSFVFTPGSGSMLLPEGFVASGFSSAINDFGVVAGGAASRAALFEPGTGVRDLGTLGGSSGFATGVNNGGQATGSSATAASSPAGGNPRAFRYSTATGMVNIDSLSEDLEPGFGSSTGLAINNAGQVAGEFYSGYQFAGVEAFAQSGSANMLRIGGCSEPRTNCSAKAINSAGQVAGDFNFEGISRGAFLYTPGSGSVSLLPSPDGYALSYGIDDGGRIVGEMQLIENLYTENPTIGPVQAFLFSGDSFTDLNTLLDPAGGAGWDLRTARDINALGQIVGIGLRNGVEHGFLLTPVPEPATWVLMLGGLALLGSATRRRTSGGCFQPSQPGSA